MSRRLTGPDATPGADNREKMVLYQTDLSPCVRRVRITLHEKGIPFDTVDVDLANMQQRSPQYLALNPNGFVPTLSHRGHVIFESAVINEYLEEQFPETRLMPDAPYERAQVRMWMTAEGAMAKIFRAVMYQRLMGPMHHISRTHEEAQRIAAKATNDEQDLSWERRVWHLQVLTPAQEAQHESELFDWLDNVERALESRDYLVGQAFSQADISMYPRIAMYGYLGKPLDARRYPNVLRWMQRLEQRPSFEASMTPQARKLRALATSPLMNSVRQTLALPPGERGPLDRLKLWSVGKLLRRVMGVDALLDDTVTVTPLYIADCPDTTLLPRPIAPMDTSAMKSKPELRLYGDLQSPLTWRVQSLLSILGLNCCFESTDNRSGVSLPDDLLAYNPQRELPVLVSEECVINGADTIADYLLGTVFCDELWTASNSFEAARSRMWLALEAGNHKELTPLWQRHVCGQESVYFIADEKLALARLRFPMGIIEAGLQDNLFLCADRPGYADLAWASRLDALMSVPGFRVEEFPALTAWYRRMQNYRDPERQTNRSATDPDATRKTGSLGTKS